MKPALILALICTTGLSHARHHDGGHIVVANRGAASLTIIDVDTDEAVNLPLPAGQAAAEPMYVNYSAASNRVFVGDRANNRVIVLDADTFEFEGTVAAGAGVFHQWVDPSSRQLWVNNDVDKTTTVIDARTLDVLATVPTPEDLVERGGKPHDVFVDPKQRAAYITVLGIADGPDYVVRFSTRTFRETHRAEVGKDPHLFARRFDRELYVACQNTNNVFALNRRNLRQRAVIDVPGAHGIFMAHGARTAYVANISGGGTDAIFTLDTRRERVVGDAVDTDFPTPHNLALTGDDAKLYVTHSGGAATQVSVFNVPCRGCAPELAGVVEAQTNPFGLGFVP